MRLTFLPFSVQTQTERFADVDPVAAPEPVPIQILHRQRQLAPPGREGSLQDVHRDAGLPREHDTGLLEHDLAGGHPGDSDDYQRNRTGQEEVREVLARSAAEQGVGLGQGDLPERNQHGRLHAAGVPAVVAGAGRAQDLPVPLPGVAGPWRPVGSGLRAQLPAGRERAAGAAAAGRIDAGEYRGTVAVRSYWRTNAF